MTILMGGQISGRIVQVLQDFLPARLTALDTAHADGITTPGILDYFEFDRHSIDRFPAVTIFLHELRDPDMLPDSFGSRLDGRYEVDVKAHVSMPIINPTDALTLQKLVHRYANGILQVLCREKTGLETVADPTRWATMVTPRRVTFGPESPQESGQMVRTAIVGVDVRRIEAA